MAVLLQLYDYLLRLTLDLLLMLVFVTLLFRPLWKLTMTRHALIIVFSKAIASFLRLFANLPVYFVNNILADMPLPVVFIFLMQGILRSLETNLALHILALAVNRAHAMLFPFHYSWFVKKKRNFYALCLLMWIVALCIGFSDRLIIEMIPKYTSVWTNRVCMGLSALFYVLFGCQMVWMKYKKTSLSGNNSTEKDSIKIFVVCLSCLLMAAVYDCVTKLFYLPCFVYCSDVLMRIYYWVYYATFLLYLCNEEICLALLVRDFRQMIGQQKLASIFCHCKSNGTTTTTTTTIEMLIKSDVPRIKVNNLVRGTG